MFSLQTKIFGLFVFLLLIVQGITLYTMYQTTTDRASDELRQRLMVSEQLIMNELVDRNAHLTQASKLLANKPQIIQMAQTEDYSTVESFLKTYSSLIADDTWLILNKNHEIVSTNNKNIEINVPFYYPVMISRTLEGHSANSFVSFSTLPEFTFQLVATPVMGTEAPIGWVVMGRLVDNDLINRVRDAGYNIHLSFLEMKPYIGWKTTASTMTAQMQQSLISNIPSLNLDTPLPLLDAPYKFRVVDLQGQSVHPLRIVLLASTNEIKLKIRSLTNELIWVVALSLFLSLYGAYAISKSITRPLRMLVDKAKRIAQGSYNEFLDLKQGGEIGQLTREFNNMQQAVAEREKDIQHHAFHDELTGLGNRVQFQDELTQAIKRAKGERSRVAVVIMDIDRFKEINDTLGHHAGDAMLVEVSKRIKESTRDGDTIARLGGDEFGLILTNISVSVATGIVYNIHNAMEAPINADELKLHTNISAGLAFFPEHGTDASSLSQNADIAMHVAKKRHLDYVIYDSSQNQYSIQRLSLMSELRKAIQNGEMQLYYQPKLNIKTDTITHVEALIRWIHPQHGFVRPDEFISLAEQTGFIKQLSQWVIEEAIRQCADWRNKGIKIKMALNISTMDLLDADLPDRVKDALDAHNLPPKWLILEVTESSVMEDPDRSLETLNQLDALGVGLAIDDFGTGYSSMAQLKQMPVSELKIDKSFVMEITSNEDDAIIVKSTIEMGHNLGMSVVAEGVESKQILEMLRSFGCDLAQGFYLTKPIPSKQLLLWLHNSNYKVDTDVDLNKLSGGKEINDNVADISEIRKA